MTNDVFEKFQAIEAKERETAEKVIALMDGLSYEVALGAIEIAQSRLKRFAVIGKTEFIPERDESTAVKNG